MVARIPTNSEAEEFSKLVSLDTIKLMKKEQEELEGFIGKKL